MDVKKILLFTLITFLVLFITSCSLEPEKNGNNNYNDQDKDKVFEYPDNTITDITYAEIDGYELLLDIYLPEDSEGPSPVVLWVHGGGWSSGDKYAAKNPARYFTAEGYAVASVNYRLTKEEVFPAQIHDIKAAIRWLRANEEEYNLNTEKIAAAGSSAGGHLAALLGTTNGNEELEGTIGDDLDYSSDVQAVVDLFGPTDFLSMKDDCVGVREDEYDESNSPESNLIGCALYECEELANQASPITYVSSDDTSFLIIHGDLDITIPPIQSDRFYQELVNAGVDAELVVAEGFEHDVSMSLVYIEEIISFLDKHIK
jgi:acetyl esterase/lipase